MIDFITRTPEDVKRSILTQREAQFLSEGYQHTLILQTATSVGNAELADSSQKAIDILSAAIVANDAELAALPPVVA